MLPLNEKYNPTNELKLIPWNLHVITNISRNFEGTDPLLGVKLSPECSHSLALLLVRHQCTHIIMKQNSRTPPQSRARPVLRSWPKKIIDVVIYQRLTCVPCVCNMIDTLPSNHWREAGYCSKGRPKREPLHGRQGNPVAWLCVSFAGTRGRCR